MPYIGSPRNLLNSYRDNNNEILDSLKTDKKESTAILENKIGPIIEDSIRLTNMERTYRLMASG
jgi:hypothetical protein